MIILPYIYIRLQHNWLLPCDFWFYKVRSMTPWIFDFSSFSAVSDVNTLRVGALLSTRCLKGPWSAHEGSLFDCFVFDVFGGSSKVVCRTWGLCFCKTWSWVSVPISWSSPSYLWVDFSIDPLLADSVILGSSWSHGYLLIKEIWIFWRNSFAISSDDPRSRFLTSCSHCLLKKKVSWDYLLISLTGFLIYLHLSPCSVEEESLG